MKITVTQEDIETAERLRSELTRSYGGYTPSQMCPIAHAARRACPEDPELAVDLHVLSLNGSNHLLPQEAVDFVRAFDLKQPVEPFAFTIEEGAFPLCSTKEST